MSNAIRFTYVGDHAQDLEGGRPVAPGERVDLDNDGQKANAGLISEGLLVKYEKVKHGETNNGSTIPPRPEANNGGDDK